METTLPQDLGQFREALELRRRRLHDEHERMRRRIDDMLERTQRAQRDSIGLVRRSESVLADVDAQRALALSAAKAGEWDLDLATNRLARSPWLDRLLGGIAISGDTVERFLDHVPAEQAAALRAYFADPVHRPWNDDIAFTRRGGPTQFLSLRLRPLRDAAGVPRRVIGVVIDITERHLAERILAQTLAEKEQLLAEKDFLIREVHHRVKNNLQMVASLLSLQARGICDPTARDLFAQALRRVSVIARIHQRLYQDQELSRVDLARHLGELINDVRVANGWEDAPLKLELQSLEVSLDVAVPLSLAANELLTNAMKYAYGGGLGWIGMRLCGPTRADPYARLEVIDRGADFPASYKPGLGLQLVRAFARQIGGDMQLDPSRSGTRIAIHWLPDTGIRHA
ncbi:MAG: sensory transduction histidine kinase [Rhodospirillales bacterium]|jgi:two-component sensor histidine kinase/PAS domain-containing protein|nr:sensory transduction histidine kinase [Rhodospirillales bacterium]